ncbi:hypothetical protein NE562_15845 [Butyricicoccus faecihominis]|uniref:hypothetical protein n=1 Tax=Butyricicoccus faecihominis TaxID=1712515 RepID=UPI002478FE23|nr:hypothetical protein [Butyricicoccus faecihominis]MCQ5131134.1 hypothetical protein [Butyricicoccus faecihominis]
MLTVCMAFLFFSAFPDFCVGDQLLFSIQLPDKLYKLFTFSSPMAVFGVISYGYTAFALVCYVRFWERFRITRNILALMLIPVMALHWTERLNMTNPVTRFTQAATITYEQTIFPQSGIWDEVFSQADYLDFLWGYSAGDTQALVPKAVEYGVKLNISQAARQSVDTATKQSYATVEALLVGSIPQNKIYVIQDVKIILPKLLTVKGLRIIHEDGYYLAVPSAFTVGDGYEELTLQSLTPLEYGASLGGLDENRTVLFTSYHNAEDNRAEVMQTIVQAAGCQEFPVTFGNKFAGILLPASRSLAAYESDSSDTVLTLEAGSDLCGGVLPVLLSLVGKTDFYDDTNLEIGATLNGRVILLPGATGVTIYAFNFQTGIVESAAWISLDGTTFCNLENFNFPIA